MDYDYAVYDKDGNMVLGCYDSKETALSFLAFAFECQLVWGDIKDYEVKRISETNKNMKKNVD